jgi:hypothetical protein
MNFNFSPNQAAQGANYAGRAMNAFQTAVNIDNQQPQPEGTTFGFRWLIRVVAVVSGLRKFSIKKQIHFLYSSFFLSCNNLWNLRGIEYITFLYHRGCFNDVRIFTYFNYDRFIFISLLVFLAFH